MNVFKRILPIIGIIIICIVCGLIYWNSHLYLSALKLTELEERIKVLKKANQFFPYNDLAFLELGKTYLDLGIQNLTDREKSIELLQGATSNLSTSLKINPFSQYSHFQYAQALLYLSYIDNVPIDPFIEYEKAAFLAGYDSEVFFEIGKVLFSRWPTLSQDQKGFTLELLIKILRERRREKFRNLMSIWKINVGDYSVMKEIIPAHISFYQMYADFLGEESLSLKERWRILAQVDVFRFEIAKNEFEAGEDANYSYRYSEGIQHYQECLKNLSQIRYYQALTDQELISLSEIKNMRKLVYLNLVRCILGEDQDFEKAKDYLYKYLELENELPALGDFESYLINLDIINKQLRMNFNDLDRLCFQLFLYFKQNRYRDIVRIGREIQQSFIMIPDEQSEDYIKLLQIIGDAHQKIDYLYDASDFYKKALEVGPDNLDTLLKLRNNYLRLNKDLEIRTLDQQIKKISAPNEIAKKAVIQKRRSLKKTLILSGQNISLNVDFEDIRGGVTPLISVFFNNQIVWEDYLENENLSFSLESEVGFNEIRIVAVNRPVTVSRVTHD